MLPLFRYAQTHVHSHAVATEQPSSSCGHLKAGSGGGSTDGV